MSLTPDELEMLWVGAASHYLGWVDKPFVELLIRHWPSIPAEARDTIGREVDQALNTHDRLRAAGINTHPLPGEAERTAQWERVRALWAEGGV